MSSDLEDKGFKIKSSIKNLFSEADLISIAKEQGFIKRQRKILPIPLFWVLILGIGSRSKRTIAHYHRQYQAETGEKIYYSSFYERFDSQLVSFLQACMTHALPALIARSSGSLLAQYQRFRDILVKDNTIVRLNAFLARKYPATRSRVVAAGIKVSVLLSVVVHGPKTITFHPERTAEVKTLRVGPWVRDMLLLMDLGFYKHHIFARITENGGYFVTRLKSTANPVIDEIHSPCPKVLKEYCQGKKLRTVLYLFKGMDLDASVSIDFKRRRYRDQQKVDCMKLRFIAEWNAETGSHHTYLTNIGSEGLSSSDIIALYKSRWEIELLFKEMKGGYGMDEVASKNEHVIQVFLFAAIITLIVSRAVYHVIRNHLKDSDKGRLNHLLWSSVFVDNLPVVLMAIILPFRIDREQSLEDILWSRLWFTLSSQCIDAHCSRKRLKDRIWA